MGRLEKGTTYWVQTVDGEAFVGLKYVGICNVEFVRYGHGWEFQDSQGIITMNPAHIVAFGKDKK